MAALAPGITSQTWSREDMWEGVLSATLMSFSWTLNFLGQPLACRLCSGLIGQNHVPWKSWLHKKPERVFSFCSFYTDGEEKGVETPLGWSTQQRRPQWHRSRVSGTGTEPKFSIPEFRDCTIATWLFFWKCIQHHPAWPLPAEISRQKSLPPHYGNLKTGNTFTMPCLKAPQRTSSKLCKSER